MGLAPTDSLAVLDALAPEPGWETEVALLSSYSVDLVAVAAVVMALAGEGDDHDAMRSAPLARACERLRDRIRVVCQAGRVSAPERGAETLVLADRWIREVSRDGNQRCWHPKLALVRYRRVEGDAVGDVCWKLWIGSRNLTRDTSWDSALTAVGTVGAAGGTRGPVELGIAEAGAVLARHAALPDWNEAAVRVALQAVSWTWPRDILEVSSFTLWPDAGPAPGRPDVPDTATRIVAVSPFVDGATAAVVGTLGASGVVRQLLSTTSTLRRLATLAKRPLLAFPQLHAMDEIDPVDGPDASPVDGDDQMEEIHRGLHAKLVWSRAPGGDELWLGSANLTARGWSGTNTEVMVRLRVQPGVGDALLAGLVGSAELVQLAGLAPPDADDADERALDKLRNTIAGEWQATLHRTEDGARCETTVPPIRADDGARLEVRRVGDATSRTWSPGTLSVTLPPVAIHQETELLVLELTLDRAPGKSVRWVARAPLDPAPGEGRDRAVLARLMGPRAFLAWLRAVLDEFADEGGGAPWPGPEHPDAVKSRRSQDARLHTPSLEAVLRAWARDPRRVVLVDRMLGTWVQELRSAVDATSDADQLTAIDELDRFHASWSVLREGLDLHGSIA